MPLTGTERVRSLIGDLPKVAIQEDVARGDGATTDFQLDMFPIRTGTLTVYNTGQSVSASANLPMGFFQLTNSAPVSGNVILATYQYYALSEDEVQSILDSASGSSLYLAAAIGLRTIAANNARFFAYTQGDKSVDKNMQTKKLMDLAESYENAYKLGITLGSQDMRIARFDDSGTEFQDFDTAVASNIPTGTYWLP